MWQLLRVHNLAWALFSIFMKCWMFCLTYNTNNANMLFFCNFKHLIIFCYIEFFIFKKCFMYWVHFYPILCPRSLRWCVHCSPFFHFISARILRNTVGTGPSQPTRGTGPSQPTSFMVVWQSEFKLLISQPDHLLFLLLIRIVNHSFNKDVGLWVIYIKTTTCHCCSYEVMLRGGGVQSSLHGIYQ